MSTPVQTIQTRIWHEEAEADNPFAVRSAHCRGYDVFGQMVGQARWTEMLCLLFRDDLPSPAALRLLEALAVALANPGPRDPSVYSAMCGGACGSPAAASLMAALAAGAGRHGGAREVFAAMTGWLTHGRDLNAWANHDIDEADQIVDIWPPDEHLPGFDPNGVSTASSVRQLLSTLAAIGPFPYLAWLAEHRAELEALAGMPLNQAGVAAATFIDLGFSPREGEMLYLILRLPGAAAHALEQEDYGFRNFPFYPVELSDDPGRQEEK
ncbi:MAG: citryl-CoA lyase [Gammaproteobacteria bacterium]|nr:citryl-CoA lyase [Gammaproteobacteria bacterium]MBU1601770.1 citryl-CoA lyase [Gammaproteobacteria bacterium]MBU2432142.1 citryl-CoA lyase [Gammaproteobacteria bacterium]MBU2450465.1 citryl-CoA lyase [Gammaproteobacteria bacterium]